MRLLGCREELRLAILDAVPVAALDPDRAGRDHVAADAAGPEHLRLTERPVGDGGLERAVAVGAAGEVLAHRRRADADQRTSSIGQRVGGGAGPDHQRHQVDVEVVLPTLERLGRFAAGVVHVDVEPAERGGRLRDEAAQGRCVGGVDRSAPHRAAPGQLGDCCRHPVSVTGADRNRRPLVEQGLGDRAADALRGSGDDRLLAGKSEIHTGSFDAK